MTPLVKITWKITIVSLNFILIYVKRVIVYSSTVISFFSKTNKLYSKICAEFLENTSSYGRDGGLIISALDSGSYADFFKVLALFN